MSYTVYMSTTLTVRTDEALREALLKRAEETGKSLSELVRAILEEAVIDRPLGERIGQLKGQLRLTSPESESWRDRLRERNWRP